MQHLIKYINLSLLILGLYKLNNIENNLKLIIIKGVTIIDKLNFQKNNKSNKIMEKYFYIWNNYIRAKSDNREMNNEVGNEDLDGVESESFDGVESESFDGVESESFDGVGKEDSDRFEREDLDGVEIEELDGVEREKLDGVEREELDGVEREIENIDEGNNKINQYRYFNFV